MSDAIQLPGTRYVHTYHVPAGVEHVPAPGDLMLDNGGGYMLVLGATELIVHEPDLGSEPCGATVPVHNGHLVLCRTINETEFKAHARNGWAHVFDARFEP